MNGEWSVSHSEAPMFRQSAVDPCLESYVAILAIPTRIDKVPANRNRITIQAGHNRDFVVSVSDDRFIV